MRKERKVVSINVLITPEMNTRIHPEIQLKEIRRSLRKWGQYKNIVIDENNLILAGSGVVEAMRVEGIKKVDAIVYYGLPENDKYKLMMADNKTAGLGIENMTNIEKIIKELDGDFDIPGFDDEVLKSINSASDEISKALGDYGKATEENLANMEARTGVNDDSREDDYSDEAVAFPGITEDGQDKKSVKCPDCGKVIWL